MFGAPLAFVLFSYPVGPQTRGTGGGLTDGTTAQDSPVSYLQPGNYLVEGGAINVKEK